MADLFPERRDHDAPEEPRVVGVDGDDADAVLSALSADTARSILTALHEEPATASELADRVDTTLQNVQYNLESLEDAGLVHEADTVYSEKGREMTVYGPADRALVVVAGREEETSGLRGALKRLLGGLAPLAVVAAAAEWLLDGPFAPDLAGTGDAGDYAISAASTEAADGAVDAGPTLLDSLSSSPGVLLFLGGVVALVAATSVAALARRRR